MFLFYVKFTKVKNIRKFKKRGLKTLFFCFCFVLGQHFLNTKIIDN